jgi:hypothetical protein
VANEFGLNHAQMRYVQRAVPGNEKFGYSQALLGVDSEWRGIEVRALNEEKQVVDNQAERYKMPHRSFEDPTHSILRNGNHTSSL